MQKYNYIGQRAHGLWICWFNFIPQIQILAVPKMITFMQCELRSPCWSHHPQWRVNYTQRHFFSLCCTALNSCLPFDWSLRYVYYKAKSLFYCKFILVEIKCMEYIVWCNLFFISSGIIKNFCFIFVTGEFLIFLSWYFTQNSQQLS